MATPSPLEEESTKTLTSEGHESEEVEEEIDEEVDEEDDEDEDLEEAVVGEEAVRRSGRLGDLVRRMERERVSVRVHDVVVKGNTKTRDSLIEAEVERLFRDVSTLQELLAASSAAADRLRRLDVFDGLTVKLEAGPPELPGNTANVVIEVVEMKNPFTGDIGIFSKPEARTWSLEGSLKLKNTFGYGDIWDASLRYGWDQTSDISFGVSLPRFKSLSTPLMARVGLVSQDWLKFSSYKEQLLGFSVGLLTTKYHDLAYNLTWRTLTDPSSMSSKSIRRQLGHSLLSSLKYTYKVDQRNSQLRPTRGYAYALTTQLGGLAPDSRSLRFIRQEIDLRCAIPLGFYKTALNLGIAAGCIMPWGRGFMDKPTPLPDRFFIGGYTSPVCSFGGPTTLLGFHSRGLGPSETRRFKPSENEPSEPTVRDFLGGDLAVTAFADLSFDLPLKLFRDNGIHGHVYASAGNLAKLSENELRSFSFRRFAESFRSSLGFGIIFPTKLFRMEV
ncbi:hypothetical protein QJS04_geneDACA006035 [Acorus gramineus]|uniref:Bacterial surface antigen (D15) domain-containing protein n=1 Tax=Acorus gramineus TaxID=55184 RepID=A0AAV9B502_ACOGR|nr:hypothetical protein QJS04_geneDACA006035 [Acorus gramineus]